MKVNKSFNVEIKGLKEDKSSEGDFGHFEGYAATYGNKDRHDDVIVKGAFAETLENGRRIKLLWQHNGVDIIGSVVESKEDDRGLFIKGRINLGTAQGREAYALLKAGDIDEMSIGFSMKRSDFEIDDENQVRMIKSLTLYEISLVTEPANTEAVVTGVKQVTKNIEDAEDLKGVGSILREQGFSKNQSDLVISKVKELSSDEQGEPVVKEETDEQKDVQGEPEEEDVGQLIGAAISDIKLHQTINSLK